MNPHFGPAPRVPAPPADGLAQAFARADRRRFRSAALASAVPVLLAAALATTPLFSPRRTGLQPVTPGITATPSPTLSLAIMPPPRDVRMVPGESPAPAPDAPATTSPAPVEPSPAPEVLPEPPRPPASSTEAITVSGYGTTTGTFRLRQGVHAFFGEATYNEEAGDYAGVYVERAGAPGSGSGVVRLAGRDYSRAAWDPLGPSVRYLPPGEYRAWLIGGGPLTVRVPVGKGQPGIAARTKAKAEATAFSADGSSAPGGQTSSRIALKGERRAVGFLTARVDATGTEPPSFDVCVTRPDEGCGSGVRLASVSGTGSWGFTVAPKHLDDGAVDLLLVQRAGRTLTMQMSLGMFLLYLE